MGGEEDERSWGLATEAPGPSPAGVRLGFVPGPGSVLGVPIQDSSWVGIPRLGGTPLLPSPGASQPLGLPAPGPLVMQRLEQEEAAVGNEPGVLGPSQSSESGNASAPDKDQIAKV